MGKKKTNLSSHLQPSAAEEMEEIPANGGGSGRIDSEADRFGLSRRAGQVIPPRRGQVEQKFLPVTRRPEDVLLENKKNVSFCCC